MPHVRGVLERLLRERVLLRVLVDETEGFDDDLFGDPESDLSDLAVVADSEGDEA